MKTTTAELIGKKARGIKHCDKMLKTINERGSVRVNLGNTGVSFVIEKNDSNHTLIQSIKYQLMHEINALEISIGSGVGKAARHIPAPSGASTSMVCEHCGNILCCNNECLDVEAEGDAQAEE